MTDARLMLGFNGLLTAMIGKAQKASIATAERSLANPGSQSNTPGKMQSREMVCFGILCGGHHGAKPAPMASAACRIHQC